MHKKLLSTSLEELAWTNAWTNAEVMAVHRPPRGAGETLGVALLPQTIIGPHRARAVTRSPGPDGSPGGVWLRARAIDENSIEGFDEPTLRVLRCS